MSLSAVRQLKLGVKLGVVLLLAGIVPLLVNALNMNHTLSSTVDDSVNQRNALLASGVVDVLDRNLFERYGDAQAFALGDAATSMDPVRITRFMDRMMPTYTPIYRLMVVADRDGKIIAVNSADENGKKIPSAQLIGRSVKDETWFRTAVSGQLKDAETLVEDKTGDGLLEKVYGKGRKAQTMRFTYPIRRDGKIVGVWSNRFNWDVIDEVLEQQSAVMKRNGVTDNVLLVNRDGTGLAGTKDMRKLVGENLSDKPVVKASLKQKHGTMVAKALDENDEDLLAFHKSEGFSTYPGVGWRAIVSQDSADALAAVGSSRKQMLLVVLLSALAIGALAWAVGRWLSRRLQRLSAFASQVAGGDLRGEVDDDAGDELGDLARNLTAMTGNLAQIARDVQHGADDVTGRAGEVLSVAASQSSAANQQVAAVSETTSAVEEIKASAAEASARAQDVANRGAEVRDITGQSEEAMGALYRDMHDIMGEVGRLADDISQLSEQAKQIEEITSTVNDLADQSNLLALNAAIEASRAGEHGKGFAVVADEVRNLAEQSKHATAQVEGILGEITSSAQRAATAASRARDVVSQKAENAEHARQLNEQVAAASDLSLQAAHQIAAAAQQQNAGMDQIAQAMKETEGAAAQLAEGASEARTAAESLTEISTRLTAVAERFKLDS